MIKNTKLLAVKGLMIETEKDGKANWHHMFINAVWFKTETD